jgi:hypothetical protein
MNNSYYIKFNNCLKKGDKTSLNFLAHNDINEMNFL